jgi:hypothetical protein
MIEDKIALGYGPLRLHVRREKLTELHKGQPASWRRWYINVGVGRVERMARFEWTGFHAA